jgi:hypothetical protein
MPVPPPRSIHGLEDYGDCLKFTIPAPKQWFTLLILPFWLAMWTIGGVFAIALFIGWPPGSAPAWNRLPESLGCFVLAWLGGWFVAEFFMAYSLLWMLTGKEIMEVRNSSITLSYKVLGLSYPKEYSAEYIRDLRVSANCASLLYHRWHTYQPNMYGFGGGLLAFDYGAKTFRVGARLDEPEARQILAAILERFPQYRKGAGEA